MSYKLFKNSVAPLLAVAALSSARGAFAAPPGAGWANVFQDNFDATKLNTNLWSKNYAQAPYNYLDHQAYMSPDQVKESGGQLYITATHQHAAAAPASFVSKGQTIPLDYTSGAINTKNKFSISGQQHDAYVEARMQLPSGVGSWPAFWLMPQSGGWPPEIDALEMPISSATGRKVVQYHYHYGTAAAEKSLGGASFGTTDLTSGFHNYGVEWGGDHMSWYVDDKLVATINNPAIEQAANMYLILDLGIGGWAGVPSSTLTSEKMRVDWVRAYQLNSTTSGYLPEGVASGNGPSTNAFHATGNASASTINAVPEPSSAIAILAATSALSIRRRRR